jgi:thiol-disulfide isomerase/thioredoxin
VDLQILSTYLYLEINNRNKIYNLIFWRCLFTVKVTLIHATWCTACPATRRFWNDLKSKYDFEYEEIDVESPGGQALVDQHGIVGVPTTLIDGELAFTGLPKKADAIARIT